ncbi:MAG: aldo/keto reductase [Clostridia bacterium]|nr:aldo/keto reductase [Clostridia bacterium]
MKYRKFSKTGIPISEISLGAEHLEFEDKKLLLDVVSACIDHGINYADFFMPSPNVRDYMKTALKGRRDKMMVAGHLGAVQKDGQYERSRDVKKCELYIEDLLTRLDTDYVDMLMLHYIDDADDAQIVLNDGLLALGQRLVRQGKARMLGFSSHMVMTSQALIETGSFDSAMFSINPVFDTMNVDTDMDGLFEKEHQQDEIGQERQAFYRFCETEQCGIVVMKAYGAGRLLDKNSAFPITMTTDQSLEYALTRPGVVSVAVGCKSVAEVDAAAAYCEASEQQRDYSGVIKKASMATSGFCMYCNHCLPCPQNINIAKTIGAIDAMEQGDKGGVRMYEEQSEVDCIACGECEERCPFGVEVIDKMQSADDLLDKLS